ncbi:MAG TPA: bifunctional [glutamate--ammonia ligase]-adenylyl-L-tyrosine phosphorylase/[glutamate--ammonia-ligase] adenylyltransferase [Verrucomicrobiota bacterium]|nr:bifunctional [glutamate--ammonia ligase]-adenylyl-L-tyrosine phosphorylase/[glutamate--ammonia-ligase] adenylyltransferase [Verrucomicrobiota bacterium]
MNAVNGDVWTRVINAAADPARVRQFLPLLEGADASLHSMEVEHARVLAAVLSGSQALGNLLVAHPDWLERIAPAQLEHPRRAEGLRREAALAVEPLLEQRDFAAALAWVRLFHQREMLRIGARDLARFGPTEQIIEELSHLADVCLDAVWRVCFEQFSARYGRPWHQDTNGQWTPTPFCVLGMGKLGGLELNYSSDVDVLFVYSEEGKVFKQRPGKSKSQRPVMGNHEFFNRVAEAFIAEVSRVTPEGMLFRIDLRLRPEGDAGPLTRSLAGYENYYAQWGQTWERMMLIKARPVAGDAVLANEFIEMIQPFRYPRAVNQNVLEEVGAMKDRIEQEVLRGDEVERNVKLGRGGIREIEFIVQSQQLLHAGKLPFLQGARTLEILEKLSQYGVMKGEDTRALREAYRFLRDVEHRLQMEDNLQTHTIPQSAAARERLARLMGFKTAKEFEKTRKAHADRVRAVFDALFRSVAPAEGRAFPAGFAGSEQEWKRILAEHAFRDPDRAFQVLREFVEGPGYVHVSPRTSELARRLLARIFALCRGEEKSGGAADGVGPDTGFRLSDPDRVLTRLDSFVAAYGARAMLFELWNSNPTIFELLLKLFDRSEFLAELAIRIPDLVDELVTSGRLRQRKTAEETLEDLRHGAADADQHLWLRQYHEVEWMRIGLRDILGLADPEQYLTEFSALADACLQYAVEAAMRKFRLKAAPFAVIGLGKLGGREIDYGSDLDVLFVADSKVRDLRKIQAVAVFVMDLLSKRTERGIVFQTDARLRPDGEKGLLVNSLAAYEEYYRKRAQLWEIQSLTRARPVAGDARVGEAFSELAAKLTNFSRPNLPLSAYVPDWKQKIHAMRMRIEKERTPAGQDELAIKTGKGGLMDAEFIAQALCLENGWREANTLHALEHARDQGQLPDADALIASYRALRRVEGILRRWSYEGETVLPDDPAPYYRVSVRCGFKTPEAFGEALAQWRKMIRAAYVKIFEAAC